MKGSLVHIHIDLRCEHCEKAPPILVEMAPGEDGIPWHLCVKCWLEGLSPRDASVVRIVDTPIMMAPPAPKKTKKGAA